MARDPKRITKYCDLLKQIWRMHPDLRLSQLILNVKKPNEDDIYYVEDDELFDRIVRLYSSKDEIDNELEQFLKENNVNGKD